MTAELKRREASDIWNLMQFVSDGNGDPSLNGAFQRMVEENVMDFPTAEVLNWSTDTYTRMLPRVLDFLSNPEASDVACACLLICIIYY